MTSPWAVTVRTTWVVTGNGAGRARSGSAAASCPTVMDRWTPSGSRTTRRRPSPLVAHQVSMRAWACSTVIGRPSTVSGMDRQIRCAAVWLAFSTTPLRFPRRGGQTSTVTA